MLRFAPSPTSDLDLSKVRIATINYLLSQQQNKQYLVRIEDLDSEHNIEGKDSEIMQILEKFALVHNGVFHQSEHLNLYLTLVLKLLKEKKAFLCTCKDKNSSCDSDCENLVNQEYSQLKDSSKKFVIRIKKPKETITYNDILQREITSSENEVDAFIILKENGIASHDFSSACDDIMSNISFIIQSEEHLLNTAKQIHIKSLLDYNNKITYAHIPNIINLDESSSLLSLFEKGFLPDAILNYLLLIGNEKLPKEIFTLPEAIDFFDINMLSNQEETFDINRLHHINREHLKLMDDKKLSTLFSFADADIGKLAKLYLDECSTTEALKEKINSIFKAKDFSGKRGKEMKVLSDIIAKAPYFETFDKLQEYLLLHSKLEEKVFHEALNYLLTGYESSPELSEIYPFIKSYLLEVAS